MSATFDIATMADELHVSPKALRATIRSIMRNAGHADALPGKGKRYVLDAKAYNSLKRQAEKAFAEKARTSASLTAALDSFDNAE